MNRMRIAIVGSGVAGSLVLHGLPGRDAVELVCFEQVGSAASTGLNGTTSQARKPHTTPRRSGPPPPSVTTKGRRPVAIRRNHSSCSGRGSVVRRPFGQHSA